MISYFLRWIFPFRCVICGELLALNSKDEWVCDECRRNIPFLNAPFCKKCGAPIGDLESKNGKYSVCMDCKNKTYAFEHGYSVFSYDIMRKSIRHFKQKGVKRDGIGLARLMYEFMELNFTDDFQTYDLLLPVPIHRKKKKQRGFNQTDILTKELSRLTGKDWSDTLLIRTKNTIPQMNLSSKQRKNNIYRAFSILDEKAVDGKKILLIDDIFTSGSTLNECARILAMAGAKEIGVFALSNVVKKEYYFEDDGEDLRKIGDDKVF